MAAAAASAWKRFALSLFLSLFFRKTLQMFLFGERENEKISSQRCIIEIGTLSLAFSLVWSSNNFSSTQLEIKDTMEVREREREREIEIERMRQSVHEIERESVWMYEGEKKERGREREIRVQIGVSLSVNFHFNFVHRKWKQQFGERERLRVGLCKRGYMCVRKRKTERERERERESYNMWWVWGVGSLRESLERNCRNHFHKTVKNVSSFNFENDVPYLGLYGNYLRHYNKNGQLYI